MKIYKFFILIFLFFPYCENEKNYEEIEKNRNIYIFLNLINEEKLKEICIRSENAALNCASNSINKNIYLTSISTYYSIITNTDPILYCENLINSSFFTNLKYSKDAIRCHLECNEKFWNQCSYDFNSQFSIYNKCLPAIWIKSCEDRSFKNCLQNCFLYGDPIWFIN